MGKASAQAIILTALLCGCSFSGTRVLWRTETTTYPNGVVVVTEGPDRVVAANIIGGVTGIATMKPWGVLAGSTVQIGNSVSQVISMPASITKQNEVKGNDYEGSNSHQRTE